MTSMRKEVPRPALLCVALALALGTTVVQAQSRGTPPPNSGQLLQQLQQPTQPPPSELNLNVQRPPTARSQNTTPIPVREIQITGNTQIPTDKLHALVASGEGQTLTLNDLDALANRVTDYYHSHGYPLAAAYVPAQTLTNGVVHIEVVEARYGNVTLQNDSAVATHVLNSTLSPLQSGQAVTGYTLERSLLLLTDIPGAIVNSVMRPGTAEGSSDLLVDVTSAPRYTGTLGLDDYGNSYTDRVRVTGTFDVNGLFHQGDLLDFNGASSGGGMNYGRLSYRYLLNGEGTTIGGAVSGLEYTLGNGLSDLHAHGSAQTQSLNLTQPFIRNTAGNLYLQVEFDHKRLHDNIDAAYIETDRHSNLWTLTLAGDQRDSYGVTNFNISGAYGHLYLDNFQTEFLDFFGARTSGSFTKWDYSLSRLQQLNPTNAIYVGFSGQLANKNLDTSEQFYLGGPTSVRGYDVGAIAGTEGNLATIEYRHDMTFEPLPGPWQASIFLDSGHIQQYKDNFIPGVNGARVNSGGLGIHWSAPNEWIVSATVATPIGNRPELLGLTTSTATRFWFQVQKGFY